MSTFPRSHIEKLSVSRLMIGTNWFLGYSHTSKAKDRDIAETMTADRIADIVEVFMNAGVDTLYGIRQDQKLIQGVREAEQRTGKKCITIAIPTLPVEDTLERMGEAARTLDGLVELGTSICMPHQGTTDAFVNRRTHSLDGIEVYLRMIRDRGMVCIGTSTPYEAAEVIELSLSILEHRVPCVELQKTRSKESLTQRGE